ncbi:heat shock 70 kDa protein 12B-like isoform X2 [Mercenaria mercenaria]|uniref:heat shock 70 kDa protein 12B-like isoform X2 n=1 Tax=Mercenaria mercenaria TaxID=6596 RepID=UPI00234EF9BA|nr:heat shock 70 kDa protein 12B-like isoform X2 [Mercenaria mercenaria]
MYKQVGEIYHEMGLIVAAIDFGTTYSGWAFSFGTDYEKDPTKADVKHWHSGTGNLVTVKTPTCLLVNPDGKTFQAFGYDAENQYLELAEKNEHKNYYYFRRFKVLLFGALGKHLTKETKVADEMGKELPAIDVFAMSIKFMVDDMKVVVNQRLTGMIMKTDIHWVLTVPAIWSDLAKQFMRQAAVKAGITTERLTIVLEPEAASLYCRHLPVNTTVTDGNLTISEVPNGSKYMVLDAGGGTIDITVHEVQSQYTLREVRAANGGDWGGIMVDKAFENFLCDLVGETVFKTFKQLKTEDWLYMIREFEYKKREAGIDSGEKVVMHFHASLTDVFVNKQQTHMTIKDAIAASTYAETVEIKRDKLKISHSVFETLFEESLHHTVEHLKRLLKDERMADVRTILMVGGYSESPLLQRAMKSAFPEMQVVIPQGASSTVLRGALIFGHNPASITERILRYTYGTDIAVPFLVRKHPQNRRVKTDVGVRCKDVFDILIVKGTKVKIGEMQINETYYTGYRNQRSMLFGIYVSSEKDPLYIDDIGCSKLGEMIIEFEELDENPRRAVNLSMVLGGTEVIVALEDEKTGNKVISSTVFKIE